MRVFYFVVCAVVVLFASSARADCVNPAGEEAVLVYNTNYKTMQFCNGSQWIGMAGGIMPVLPGNSMVDGWPDVIQCNDNSLGSASLYLDGLGTDGSMYYRRLGADYSNASSIYGVYFNSAGAYAGHENMAGFDCVTGTKSISALYAEGKAFNLNGGGGGGGGTATQEGAIKGDGWPDALVCTVTTGTFTDNIYTWSLEEPLLNSSTVRYELELSDTRWVLDFSNSNKNSTAFSGVGPGAGSITATSCNGKNIEALIADSSAKFFAATNSDNPLVGLSCSNGQVAEWSGTAWTCGTVGGSGPSIWVDGTTPGDIYYDAGKVGIGTDDPLSILHVGTSEPLGPASKNFLSLGSGHIWTAHPNGALVLNSGPDTGGLSGIWFRRVTSAADVTPYVDLMRITADGNVGIGTTNPNHKLHVLGGAYLAAPNGSIFYTAQSDSDFDFTQAAGSTKRTLSIHGANGGGAPLEVYGNNGSFQLGLRVTSDGNIATNGNGFKPGGGSWAATSDARLKNIDGDYEQGLESIIKLNPIRFHYKKDNPRNEPSEKEYVGLIAQDAQAHFPEAVFTSAEDEYLSLDTTPIMFAVINAIKELKSENDKLRGDLEAYKAAHP